MIVTSESYHDILYLETRIRNPKKNQVQKKVKNKTVSTCPNFDFPLHTLISPNLFISTQNMWSQDSQVAFMKSKTSMGHLDEATQNSSTCMLLIPILLCPVFGSSSKFGHPIWI